MESNWKELQEAQTLAATEPGSISGMFAVMFHVVRYTFKTYLLWISGHFNTIELKY